MTSTDRPTPVARRALSGLRGRLSRDETVSAAVALAVVLVARFALALLALIGSAIGFSVTAFPSGFLATPVGQFLGSFVLYPFPFYLAAAVVLVFVSPMRTDAPLAGVLRSALVAGAIGTAALVVVGIAPGIVLSLSGHTWANLALYLTTIPLSNGIVDTALLTVGCVASWLWARRERDRLGEEPGEYIPRARSPRAADPSLDVSPVDDLDEGPAVITGDAPPVFPVARDDRRAADTVSRAPAAGGRVAAKTEADDASDQSRFAPPDGL